MRTEQEYTNIEAERDALLRKVEANEQYEQALKDDARNQIQELTEALEAWKASAYRSQTDCAVAGATIQQLKDERDALAARVQEMREALLWCHHVSGKVQASGVVERLASTPDTSVQILARHDAATLQRAAQIFRGEVPFNFVAADGYSNGFDVASELDYMAYELLKGLEKEHGN